jgi:hypothetical protein
MVMVLWPAILAVAAKGEVEALWYQPWYQLRRPRECR